MRNKPRSLVSFYKIDKRIFSKISEDKIVEKIMNDAEGYFPETKYKSKVFNKFSVVIYYSHPTIKYNKWDAFFSPVLDENNDTFNITSKSRSTEMFQPHNTKSTAILCFGVRRI